MDTDTEHRWVVQVDDKPITDKIFHTDKRCPRLGDEQNVNGGKTLRGSGSDPGPKMWQAKMVHVDLTEREASFLGVTKCGACLQRDRRSPVNAILSEWFQDAIDDFNGLRAKLDAAGYKIVTQAEGWRA